MALGMQQESLGTHVPYPLLSYWGVDYHIQPPRYLENILSQTHDPKPLCAKEAMKWMGLGF
jgi:hypothetical protein